MFVTPILSTDAAKAAIATTTIAAVRQVADGSDVIQVGAYIYSGIAVLLSLVGVYLARLVTIDAENKRLGRTQSMRETGPLTWIAILVVGPIVWQQQIAIPWAPIIGLGVGYSVRTILKIFGGGATAAARAIARRAADALDDEEGRERLPMKRFEPPMSSGGTATILPPNHDGPDGPARQKLLDQLDQVHLPKPEQTE